MTLAAAMLYSGLPRTRPSVVPSSRKQNQKPNPRRRTCRRAGLGMNDVISKGQGLAVERAIQGRRNIPTERARHRAPAHRVEAVFRREGGEGAADTAEKRFRLGLRKQESGFAIGNRFGQATRHVADRERSGS